MPFLAMLRNRLLGLAETILKGRCKPPPGGLELDIPAQRRAGKQMGESVLEFSTEYPCPVPFVHNGGDGFLGLCGMEVVSVLTGDHETAALTLSVKGGNGRYLLRSAPMPKVNVPSVAPVLRSMVMAVNDYLPLITREMRADTLWPILPKVMDSTSVIPKGMGTPKDYRDPASIVEEYLKSYPVNQLGKALGFQRNIADSPTSLIRLYASAGQGREERWGRAVSGLKMAVELFWKHYGGNPRDDFTPEEIRRLLDYKEANADNYYLKYRESVTA